MRQRLTNVARALRKQETNSEQKLWRELRGRQLDGWKFKRQVPRGRFVVDFLCLEAGLVIEIDGAQHLEPHAMARDELRTRSLKAMGLRVLRVTNSEVLENLDGVLDSIYSSLGERTAPSPGAHARRPLPQGRGDAAGDTQ